MHRPHLLPILLTGPHGGRVSLGCSRLARGSQPREPSANAALACTQARYRGEAAMEAGCGGSGIEIAGGGRRRFTAAASIHGGSVGGGRRATRPAASRPSLVAPDLLI
jgi:hypothetical protein